MAWRYRRPGDGSDSFDRDRLSRRTDAVSGLSLMMPRLRSPSHIGETRDRRRCPEPVAAALSDRRPPPCGGVASEARGIRWLNDGIDVCFSNWARYGLVDVSKKIRMREKFLFRQTPPQARENDVSTQTAPTKNKIAMGQTNLAGRAAADWLGRPDRRVHPDGQGSPAMGIHVQKEGLHVGL